MHSLRRALTAFFNWSEKALRTDTRYIAKGGFWLAIGKAVGVLSGIVLSVGFANLLPQDVFGTYQFVLSLSAIVGAFTLTGMGKAIQQAVARGHEGALRAGFISKLKWSTGVALAAFAIALYYFINDNYTLATSMLVVGTLTPFQNSFKLASAYLTGKKEFRAATILGAWRKPIPLLTILATITLTDNLILIVLAYFASHTVSAALIYYKIIKTYAPPRNDDVGELFSFSKHLSAMNLLSRIAANADKILLFHFLGAAPVAVYTFAKLIPQQITSLSGILKTLAFPKLSTQSIQNLQRSLPRKAGLFFVVALAIAGAYVVVAPFIFELAFPKYTSSILFSQVFAISLLFAPGTLFMETLFAHAKKRELYIVRTASPFIKIVLLLILVPTYGIWGAVATYLATQAATLCATLFLFMRAR